LVERQLATNGIPVFTFVTDRKCYREMQNSFERAGFTQRRATFIELVGAGGPGEPEPYSIVSKLIRERPEPFVILCHQDVRLNQGHGFDALTAALRDLTRRDPMWAIAGNAGGSRLLRVTRCLTDPYGGSSHRSLPALVHSLDENFLVLRTGTGVECTSVLAGFHLFGTDVCLNALRSGRTAYVINFHLQHLSAGRRDSAYEEARDRFVAYWNAKYAARYLRTTVEVLFLSRWKVARRILGIRKLRSILKNHASAGAVAGILFAPRLRPSPRPGRRRDLGLGDA
jgi:hypothetical protein